MAIDPSDLTQITQPINPNTGVNLAKGLLSSALGYIETEALLYFRSEGYQIDSIAFQPAAPNYNLFFHSKFNHFGSAHQIDIVSSSPKMDIKCAVDIARTYIDFAESIPSCYCVSWKFPKDEIEINTEEEEPPGIEVDFTPPGLDISTNFQNDFIFPDQSNVYGRDIPEIHGKFSLTAPIILSLDRPYLVPKQSLNVEYKKDVNDPAKESADLIDRNSDNFYKAYIKPITFKSIISDLSDEQAINFQDKNYDLTTKLFYKTTYLISLGQSDLEVIDIHIGSKKLTEGSYIVSNDKNRGILMPPNGDQNSLKYVPAYRDHGTIILLLDTDLTDSTESISIRCVQRNLQTVFSSSDITEQLISSKPQPNEKTAHYFDGGNIYSVYLDRLLIKNTATGISFPSSVTSEPVWWRFSTDSNIYYLDTTDYSIKKYDPVSGLDYGSILNIDSSYSILDMNSHGFVYDSPTGLNYFNYFLPVTDSFKKVVMYTGHADVFSNTKLYRLRPESPAVVSYNITNDFDTIGRTTEFYLLFNNSSRKIYIYRTMEFSLLHVLDYVPDMSTIPEIETKFYSGQTTSFYVSDSLGKIFSINLTSMEIKFKGDTAKSVTYQFFNRILFLYDGSFLRSVNVNTQDITTLTINNVLTSVYGFSATIYKLGDNININGAYVESDFMDRVTSYLKYNPVNSISSSKVLDLKKVSELSEEDEVSVSTPIGIKFNSFSEIKPIREAIYSVDDVNLDTDIVNQTDISYLNLTNNQLNALADLIYISSTVTKDDKVSFSISDYSVYPSTVVEIDGQYIFVEEESVGSFSKIKSISVRTPSISLVQRAIDLTQDAELSLDYTAREWDIINSKAIYIPVKLIPQDVDSKQDFTLGYIGKRPIYYIYNVNLDKTLPVPQKEIPLVGSLQQTTIYYKQDLGIIDDINTFRVKFSKPPTGVLASATYDDLVLDWYKNLIIVGYEAIQFMDYTILADGVTVDFSGLLRGRFNTSAFINHHKPGETVYYIEEGAFVSAEYVSDFNRFFLSSAHLNAKTTSQLYSHDIGGFYEGTVNVIESYQEGNFINIRLQEASDDTVVYISNYPFLFETVEPNKPYYFVGTYNNLIDISIDISNLLNYIRNKIIYIKVSQRNRFSYVFPFRISERSMLVNEKISSICVVGPRDTLAGYKTTCVSEIV